MIGGGLSGDDRAVVRLPGRRDCQSPDRHFIVAIPLLIQSYGIFILSWGWARNWKLPHDIAGPCALFGTSNFFELTVVVAISLFGIESGAALATVAA